LSGYKSFNVVEFDAGGESRYMSVGDDASLQFSTGGFAIAMCSTLRRRTRRRSTRRTR
jgi:hypothetical protein